MTSMINFIDMHVKSIKVIMMRVAVVFLLKHSNYHKIKILNKLIN